MEVISSRDNEKVKAIRKLKEKKYRDQDGKYIIEGIKLVQEAINQKVDITSIVICEDCAKNEKIDKKLLYEIAKYECIYVTQKVFDTLTEVETHQGIIGVIKKKIDNNKIEYTEDIIIVLDDIQDPGNLGTILRTVDSAGIKQLILSKDCADSYNPKVVRSTMGAIFRVNIIESKDIVETLKEIKKQKYEILATSLDTKDSIYDVEYIKKAIIIGNESKGISNEALEVSNKKVKIPMLGNTESLNASVATGIIIYEYVRQMSKRGRALIGQMSKRGQILLFC